MNWYFNRLMSMSFPEIIFRVSQLVQKYYERTFLAGKSVKLPQVSTEGVRLDLTGIESFGINGNIKIFGKDFNYKKGDIDWHTDIFSNKKFPLHFSKSTNIRSHADLSAKVVWEINRMQFLPLIALNYKLNRKEADLNLFVTIVSSWIEENPYLLGVNWYSNIEVNLRLIVWYFCWKILDVEQLVKQNETFKIFVENIWLTSIYQHCIYSYKNPSKYSSSNNHLISEYAGLFIASTLWKFPETAKWITHSKKGLEKEILRQHSPNGINKEEAAEYIQFITDFFLLAYVAGKKSDNHFSKLYEDRLKEIFYYIHNLLDINGNFPKYGDEDDGKCITFSEDTEFNNFHSLLTSGAIIFNDPVLKSRVKAVDLKNLVLFGSEAKVRFDGIKPKPLQLDSKFYKEEGHFIFRHFLNDKEIYLHFDAAPLGFLSIAAHGHADALSFILHINGQPFFIDSGTYTYHTEYEWRKYFIGTLAHNTVRINKKDQAEIGGATLWLNHFKTNILSSEIGQAVLSVEAQHDGYKKMGIIHKRKILFERSDNIIRIIDTIQCKKKGEYFLEIPFHLHPKIYITPLKENIFSLKDQKGCEIFLETENMLDTQLIKGQTNPFILGWYSNSFMDKEQSNTIYCNATIAQSKTIETKIRLK